MTPLRTTLTLLLLVAALVLTAGCIGALTGNRIDRNSLNGSDKIFFEKSLEYDEAAHPYNEGILKALNDDNWDYLKINAEGLKNVSGSYSVLLNRDNFTVSPKMQQYQDAVMKEIIMNRCSGENLIFAAETRENTSQQEYYMNLATDCKHQVNEANIEIISMLN